MSDPLTADIVMVANCPPECCCQSVHIQFLDADGDVFASIPLAAADARMMARDILQAADLADAQSVKLEGRLS